MSQVALPVAGPRRIAASLASMILGTLGVIALLLVMNRPVEAPRARPGMAPVSFEVKAPPPKPRSERPQPQRPQPRKAPAPPAPMLSAGLPGLSFGLPQQGGGMSAVDDALLGDRGAAIMTADSVDAPPRLSQGAEVVYPPRARAKGVTGSVTLSLVVEADGSVGAIEILDATPPGVFEDAAVAAVRRWRFEPGSYEGRAVAVRARQTLRFDLN